LQGTLSHTDLSSFFVRSYSGGIRIHGRHYHKVIDKLFYTTTVYGQASRIYSTSSSTTIFSSNANAFQFGIQPGFAYFITDRLGFDLFVGDVSWTETYQKGVTGTVGNERLNFDILQRLGLGVSYLF